MKLIKDNLILKGTDNNNTVVAEATVVVIAVTAVIVIAAEEIITISLITNTVQNLERSQHQGINVLYVVSMVIGLLSVKKAMALESAVENALDAMKKDILLETARMLGKKVIILLGQIQGLGLILQIIQGEQEERHIERIIVHRDLRLLQVGVNRKIMIEN